MAQESPSDQHADGSYIAQAGPGGRASITVSPTPPPPTDLNRRRLLSKVRTFRITDELESSLRGTAFIELGLQERPDAVIKSQRSILQDADYPILPLPPGMHITQVYDRAGEELLILGAPGTGKTTLLLQLTRDLLDRARQDESHPIPAVFNLSSWATKRQPLGEWLVDELHIGYQVSPKLGQEWVAENRILPLLDGLDEVAGEHRTACIEAINTYRDEHGLVPMVICCRSADYDDLDSSTRLSLRNAIVVQPLTAQQVDDYLASGGEKLSALREVLQTDPDLQEMAATPLMLSVLTQAYAGRRPDELLVANSPQLRRQQIFATYVERMLHRRGPKTQYTPQQVKHWLSWLAKQMTQHSQTEFYLERMQPDWLSPESGWLSLFFGTFVRVSIWLFFGLVAWLTFGLHNVLLSSSQLSMSGNALVFGLISGLVYGLVSQMDTSIKPTEIIRWSLGSIWQRLRKSEALLAGLLFALLGVLFGWLDPQELLNKPIEMLLGGLIFGVLGGLLFSLLVEFVAELARNTQEQETHTTLNQGIWHSVYNHVLVGLIFGLVNGLIFGLLIALLVGMIEIQANSLPIVLQDMLKHGVIGGVFIWILSGLLFGVRCRRMETDLKPMKVFVWLCRSVWRHLVKSEELTRGLAFGLIFALLFWMIEMAQGLPFRLTEGLVYGLLGGLIFRLLSELVSGLSSEMMEEQTLVRPNQGIWHSARNSVIVGLVFGVLATLFFGLIHGLLVVQGDLKNRLFLGLCIGVSYGLLSAQLIGLPNGGVACIQHGILRLLLWRTGSIPRDYTRFLNYSAERILLRKIGGGYIFIHKLLLEYFATLNSAPTPTKAAERDRWKDHVSKLNSFILFRVGLAISIILGVVCLFWYQSLRSYPAAHANVALVDSLGANRGIWPEQSDPYGACRFTNHAYQVTSNSENPTGEYCHANFVNKNNFRNFTIEVEMTIVKGDYAGLIFRNKIDGTAAYYFLIEQDGTYKFNSYLHNDNTGDINHLASDLQPKIRRDFHQPNTIAVVARGSSFELYINHQFITSVNDPKKTSDQGVIGFITMSPNNKTPSEALFRHAKVWVNG